MTTTKDLQRQVTIITSLGKRYSGFIDIPNSSLRTTDLFNSKSAFWKNQQGKCFDDGILLHKAKILFSENNVYKEFDTLQLRLSGVIAFFDEFISIGSENERTRFETIKKKTGSQSHNLNIITRVIGNSFYEINGSFEGTLRTTTNNRFIPLIQAKLTEIVYNDLKWFKKPISIPSQFLGVNSNFIEALDINPAA
jgi:hypothetical protein